MSRFTQTVIIENIEPMVDGGRYPIKREIGDSVTVSADIFKDGHEILIAELRYRRLGISPWSSVRMQEAGNDRWTGSFEVTEIGRTEYTIRAYADVYRSWLADLSKRHQAGMDVESELLEGRRLIEDAWRRSRGKYKKSLAGYIGRLQQCSDSNSMVRIAGESEIAELMDHYADLSLATQFERVLEIKVDRLQARFAAWYEFFPRSQSPEPGRSGTFRDCEARLPEIREMGFEVVYLPPIHPIGRTKRKGPNNTLKAGPDDPGSPYATGNEHGGHKSVEPSLGTLKDFDHFIKACQRHGMEVALDFAINCSPDHPYVEEHPDWFFRRPDGTIKYAENPPKKYEDIYPLNFQCADRKALWEEMRSIVLFWIERGVKIFRVDNPHTKPLAMWEWMIESIQKKHPDTIFLSEAFTRPKMMRALAKAGFTQSYTYFTWRNFKHELIDYLTELTTSPVKEYFRGNFFVNTPDILPTILQEGGRPAFKMRITLAATLMPAYGMYSSFELCEAAAIPGTEEYLNSEKYEIKHWDWNRSGNIKDYVRRLNEIRRLNVALQEYDNLEFCEADDENILFYAKYDQKLSNIILVAVNLDPFQMHHSYVYVPLQQFGIRSDEIYQVHDLISEERYLWHGEQNYVELDPGKQVAHIFRLRRWQSHKNAFD